MTLDSDVEDRIRDAPLSAHFATSVADRPHVAPVWYGYRDDTLYTLTGGKKLENVRRNPRVAVSIEQGDRAGGVEWGVTALGRATVVEDPDRIEAAEEWIYDAYDQHGTGDGNDNEADDGDDLETGDGSDEEFDPGEPSVDYALLEIDIGSSTVQVY